MVWCAGVVRCGAARCDAVRCGAMRWGAARCGAVWCGAVRCGVMCRGVAWCGAVRCEKAPHEIRHLVRWLAMQTRFRKRRWAGGAPRSMSPRLLHAVPRRKAAGAAVLVAAVVVAAVVVAAEPMRRGLHAPCSPTTAAALRQPTPPLCNLPSAPHLCHPTSEAPSPQDVDPGHFTTSGAQYTDT